jgi:hypothetical protein
MLLSNKGVDKPQQNIPMTKFGGTPAPEHLALKLRQAGHEIGALFKQVALVLRYNLFTGSILAHFEGVMPDTFLVATPCVPTDIDFIGFLYMNYATTQSLHSPLY